MTFSNGLVFQTTGYTECHLFNISPVPYQLVDKSIISFESFRIQKYLCLSPAGARRSSIKRCSFAFFRKQQRTPSRTFNLSTRAVYTHADPHQGVYLLQKITHPAGFPTVQFFIRAKGAAIRLTRILLVYTSSTWSNGWN